MSKERNSFLKQHNLSSFTATIDKWIKFCDKNGKNWKTELLLNPYKLAEVGGIGFRYADGVAMRLGVEKNDTNRLKCYMGYVFDDLSEGSTILSISSLIDFVAKKLETNDCSAIMGTLIKGNGGEYVLLNSKYKQTKELLEMQWVTKKQWYNVEKGVFNLCVKASKLPQLKYDENIVERVKEKASLNEMQSYAVDNIFKTGVNVLTGGAGSGKTYTTKAVLKVLEGYGQTFTALAPTGIASKVFAEATGHECSTVHRAYYGGEGIETDWLILEESSMLSCDHFEMILQMVNGTNVKLIFIGDISQLQPISAGSILRDLIRLIEQNKIKGNIIQLTEIMRASDETFIPHLCKKFTRLDSYDKDNERKKHKSVSFHPLSENVIQQTLKVIEDNNFDFKDTYILTPQRVGDVGANVINEYIDVNITGGKPIYSMGKKEYRIGSVIMHTKNNAKMNVYNGERLIITGVNSDRTRYTAKKIADGEVVFYDDKMLGSQTMLSYVCTVHKTQGITAKNVVFIASRKHTFMLTRELVYTGLSRASENLVILHDEHVLDRASKKEVVDIRKTFLGEIALLGR